MDMISIGKFIAELRREQNLSQEQLGEKIGVTNKTVSRWETGKYMPPADALLAMSELFSVSVNEILSAKRLGGEDYKQAAEENLITAIRQSSFSAKEKMDFYKKKWLREHIAVMCAAAVGIIAVLLVGLLYKLPIPVGSVPLLLLIAHCLRNNAMMSYAERHAYDIESR